MIEEFIDTSFRAAAALLAALKHRDAHTEEHCSRVARLAWLTARELGFSETDTGCLVSGAILHDVGKIGIPDEVLLKNGALDAEQFEVIKRHSEIGCVFRLKEIGANIVEKLEIPTAGKVSKLVRWHHERIDGGGYPDGLRGDEIPIGARVISAVDAFDAITSDRCYRDGVDAVTAVRQLEREQDSRFGADVVSALESVVAKHGDKLILGQVYLHCAD